MYITVLLCIIMQTFCVWLAIVPERSKFFSPNRVMYVKCEKSTKRSNNPYNLTSPQDQQKKKNDRCSKILTKIENDGLKKTHVCVKQMTNKCIELKSKCCLSLIWILSKMILPVQGRRKGDTTLPFPLCSSRYLLVDKFNYICVNW